MLWRYFCKKNNLEQTVLVVEDDEDIRELLRYNLQKAGLTVHAVGTGREVMNLCKKIRPDLVILDVMLPDIDGIEVCEFLRKDAQLTGAYILFLSARGEDYSQVAGYRAGGDDYIVKPVSINVLMHKVRAALSRISHYHMHDASPEKVVLNTDRFSIRKNGKESIIPKKEFELLSYLMSSPDKVFRREEILANVWGHSNINDRTIDVHVRKLRERFGSSIIRTVKGVGYRYMG